MQHSSASVPRVPTRPSSSQAASPHPRVASSWTYAALMVLDGPRQLKPSQVAHDRLIFPTPPRLTGTQIQIILTNAGAEQRRTAAVLPHDPDATRIPIRLI